MSNPIQVQRSPCRPQVSLLSRGYGAPDDVTVSGRSILFGDTSRGLLAALDRGRLKVLVRGLDVPEGIVVRPKGRIIIAEQGRNRLDLVNLRNGRRSVFLRLSNRTGREGVDGIAAAGSDLIIPDSPNGQVLRLHGGRLRVLARGLGRPVGAVPFAGGIAVADETDNAVWLLRSGHVRRLATLNIPDDVAILRGRLFAVSLGDGALWQVTPHAVRLLAGFGEPQGLAALGPRTVVVADSRSNRLVRVFLPATCLP